MAKVSISLKEPETDPLFAKRMEIALDNHPSAPAMNAGRLTWLLNEMMKHGNEVTLQSIHRWYHGNAKPRSRKLSALAEVLGVDPMWLLNGKLPELDDATSRRLQVVGDGSINALTGFIQMSGWQCAFPDENDENGSFVHIYAIVKARQLRIHICQSIENDEDASIRFRFTTKYDKCIVLGLARTGSFQIDVLPFPAALIRKHSELKSGVAEISVKRIGGKYFVGSEEVTPLSDVEAMLNL